MARRFLFALWVLFASGMLLELALRMGAAFVEEEAPSVELADVDEKAIRVVALGDSWVAGAEAPDGQGFIDHIGRDLSAQLPGAPPIQLTNLGRTGANSAHVALRAHEQLPALLPHLVIVLVGQNNSTNFYGVAEVEELLGKRSERRLSERLRVVKLARITWANLSGSSGMADRGATRLPAIPSMRRDDQENPLNQLRVLGSPEGQNYLWRRLEAPIPAGSDPALSAGWELLGLAAQRDLAAAATKAQTVRLLLGLSAPSTQGVARTAPNDRELLGRYALMRLALQERDWRSVRHHAQAGVGYQPRGVLSDLMAAEAHLLAGDWRAARAYLESAHNMAPGFADTIDLASRFPAAARNPAVYEALEFRPLGVPLAYEVAPVLDQLNQEERALEAQRAWVASVPGDDTQRADLAIRLVQSGRRPQADQVMGLRPDTKDRISTLQGNDPDRWRYGVLRAKATGDREHTRDMVAAAMTLPVKTADLLGAAVEALSAHELCNELPEVADRWFELRGDANAYIQAMSPCVSSEDAELRLRPQRTLWTPLGSAQTWRALAMAGHRPFELLYRDLELVLSRAEEVGAQVALVTYPNPSEDHTALREVLASFANGRPLTFVDSYRAFEERFADDPEGWADHLGPNGHANAAGYRFMADDVLKALRESRVLDKAAGQLAE